MTVPLWITAAGISCLIIGVRTAGSGSLYHPALSLKPAAELSLAYSPEAELALQINGLDAIPIMGYGQVYRSAQLAGIRNYNILKPRQRRPWAPSGRRYFVMGWGPCRLPSIGQTGGEATYFERLPALDLHIFEDWRASILGVKSASQMLTQLGIPVTLHAWGIASSPVKVAALRSAEAEIFRTCNTRCSGCTFTFILKVDRYPLRSSGWSIR